MVSDTSAQSELVDTLILSARYGDAEDILACLEAGANVNAQDERGSTGMYIFSIYRCMVLVDRLRMLMTL